MSITIFTSSDNGPVWKNGLNNNFTDISSRIEDSVSEVEVLFDALEDSSVSNLGLAKTSVSPILSTEPIVVGDNDPRMPTQNENDAMSGTHGTPSSSNKFITQTDANFTGNVTTSGNQSVAGVKTFNSIPLVTGTPSSINDMVDKEYVDSLFVNF